MLVIVIREGVLTWGVVNATGLYIGLYCVITRDINDNSPNILDCKALGSEDLFFCINLPLFFSGKDSKNQASAVLRSTFTFHHPRRSWKRMAKPSGDGDCREYLRVLVILRPHSSSSLAFSASLDLMSLSGTSLSLLCRAYYGTSSL